MAQTCSHTCTSVGVGGVGDGGGGVVGELLISAGGKNHRTAPHHRPPASMPGPGASTTAELSVIGGGE